MKKRILCYGDSNTWGYIPGNGNRYDEETRWPKRLQALLSDEFEIIEEGLSGRTTVFSNRVEPYRSGVEYLPPCLLTHFPLDYIIVMLGTNDTKPRYHVSALEIGYGMEEFLLAMDYWCRFKEQHPQILVVSPIRMHITDENGDFDYTSEKKRDALGEKFACIAQRFGCKFLDADMAVKDIGCDGVHMTEDGHRALAEKIAKMIQ